VDEIKQFATPTDTFEAYISADPARHERVTDEEDYSRATCDHCGIAVRARFVIALPSGGIVCYCGSHTKQHWAALNETGALIVQLSTV